MSTTNSLDIATFLAFSNTCEEYSAYSMMQMGLAREEERSRTGSFEKKNKNRNQQLKMQEQLSFQWALFVLQTRKQQLKIQVILDVLSQLKTMNTH